MKDTRAYFRFRNEIDYSRTALAGVVNVSIENDNGTVWLSFGDDRALSMTLAGLREWVEVESAKPQVFPGP